MKKILISAATAMLLASTAFAAEEPREPDLGRTFPVAGNVHIALFENRNSVFLVDDERILLSETNFERNAENLRNIIATVSPAPVELIINTHWHGDHIGGNKFFHEHGAVTLSHENTRIRMSEDQVNPVTNQVQLPAQAPEFLPMYKRVIDEGYHMTLAEAMAFEARESRTWNANVSAAAIEARRGHIMARGKQQLGD